MHRVSNKFTMQVPQFRLRFFGSGVFATAAQKQFFGTNVTGGRSLARKTPPSLQDSQHGEQASHWPRRIFSGIQPTGALHLGNYLGAVRKWVQLQNKNEDVTVCIVDMHSITLPQSPPVLRENIFKMAATLIACGVDPTQSTLFVQSAVVEHCEFNWILNCMTTMPRLAQLPQFKDKSRLVRDIPLGLYVYPVLQAADIMLYKATHVPVGLDQLQHIQLAQHLTRTFNNHYGEMFPVCHAMIDNEDAGRIRSLRDPTRKMSKSDANAKATINLCDEPDVIVEKIKKAVTDFTSDISYEPETRPGVSNLVGIHSLVTGLPVKSIVEEAKTIDTGKYKMRVAEAVIEHLRPIREQVNQHMSRRNELIYMLQVGAEKARQQAQQTMTEVKQRLGLGTYTNMPLPAQALNEQAPVERSSLTASQRLYRPPTKRGGASGANVGYSSSSGHHGASGAGAQHHTDQVDVSDEAFHDSRIRQTQNIRGVIRTTKPLDYRPVVPVQKMRIEKTRRSASSVPFHVDTMPMPQPARTSSFRHTTPVINSVLGTIYSQMGGTGGVVGGGMNKKPTVASSVRESGSIKTEATPPAADIQDIVVQTKSEEEESDYSSGAQSEDDNEPQKVEI